MIWVRRASHIFLRCMRVRSLDIIKKPKMNNSVRVHFQKLQRMIFNLHKIKWARKNLILHRDSLSSMIRLMITLIKMNQEYHSKMILILMKTKNWWVWRLTLNWEATKEMKVFFCKWSNQFQRITQINTKIISSQMKKANIQQHK